MESLPQDEPWARRLGKTVLRHTVEAVLVLGVLVVALRVTYPSAISQRDTHLWSYSEDPYAQGDLNGVAYMVMRAASGETGCDATTHGIPWSWDLCSEIPNPVVTDLLGSLVSRWGMPLGYNLGILLFLATNGLAVFWVVRLWGARAPPALFAGIAAAIAPALISEVEGGFVQHSWWAPAILATGFCVASIASWRRFWLVLPGAFCLMWSVPIYAMMAFKLLPWTLAAGAVAVFVGEDRRGRILRAVLGGGIAMAFALPIALASLDSAGPRLFEGEANANTLMLGLMAFTPGDLLSFSWGSGDLNRMPVLVGGAGLLAAGLAWREARLWAPALLSGWLLMLISLGPSLGDGGFNGALPYVWLMEHVDLARGSMRPVRYGVAGGYLLCIGAGIALGILWDRYAHRKAHWAGWAGLCWLLILQVRPQAMTPDLAWPPIPSLSAVEGSASVLDIPLAGANERRFALWAYHPAPRLNPAHDVERWRDKIRVPAGQFPLLTVVDDFERDEAISEARMERLAQPLPEVTTHGLRFIAIHTERVNPQKLEGWKMIFSQTGARLVSQEDGVLLYAIAPG